MDNMEDTESCQQTRKMRSVSLTECLPTELVLDISDLLCAQDRWALMRTCRGLHDVLEKRLWRPGPRSLRAEQRLTRKYGRTLLDRYSISRLDSSHAGAMLWALEHKDCALARRALSEGAVEASLLRELLQPVISHSGSAELLDIMLAALPDKREVMNGSDRYGRREPLIFEAVACGTPAIFETLLRHGANPNGTRYGDPIIYSFTHRVGLACAPLLLQHGASLAAPVHGLHPLRFALKSDRAYLLPFFARAGTSVDNAQPRYSTAQALCCAASYNAERCTRALLHGGADPLTRAPSGQYAFLLGPMDERKIRICRLFLDHGVPVDVRCRGGATLLMWAARSGTRPLASFLLRRGADATLVDDNGQSALDHAYQVPAQLLHGRLDLAADLVEAACRRSGHDPARPCWRAPWRTAFLSGHQALLGRIVERNGIDPAARDPGGETMLTLAARRFDAATVREHRLLAWEQPWWPLRRAAATRTDGAGNTALYWAVYCGAEDLCRRLLRAGADVDVVAADGRLLLAVAAAGWSPAVLRLLLPRVADVNAQDCQGRTALAYAACNHNLPVMRDMVTLLLEAGAALSLRLREYDDGLRPWERAWRCGQGDEFDHAVEAWKLRRVAKHSDRFMNFWM